MWRECDWPQSRFNWSWILSRLLFAWRWICSWRCCRVRKALENVDMVHLFIQFFIRRSVALLLQIALPAALFCDRPVVLNLTGGTNCEMAPQIDFSTEIFRPNLEKFGATFDFDLIRRGYFPKGGGLCKISVRPVHHLNPIDLTNVGDVKKYFGWSFVSGTLPIKVLPSSQRHNLNLGHT